MRALAIYYDIKTLFLLPYRAVSYLQSYVHITSLALDVVGIEHLGISTFQDAALTTRLAIVQAFPGF